MRHTLTLRYFEAVARTGSIRAAAEQLAITSSALNRRIQTLEGEFGVELFERRANGVRLNSAGEIFIEHVRGQLADLERVRSRIADLSGMRRGHVRISATRELARHFLPSEVLRYRQQYPGVSFDVRSMSRAEAEDAVITQQSDLSCVIEPARISEFHVLLQAPQTIHVIGPLQHPLLQRAVLRLHEVIEQRLMLPPRGDGIRELLQHAATRRMLPLQAAVESDDPALLESLAASECGLCFSIRASIGPQLAQQGLAAVPLDPRDVRPAVLLVGHLRMRSLPVAAARFAEDLRKRLESNEPDGESSHGNH